MKFDFYVPIKISVNSFVYRLFYFMINCNILRRIMTVYVGTYVFTRSLPCTSYVLLSMLSVVPSYLEFAFVYWHYVDGVTAAEGEQVNRVHTAIPTPAIPIMRYLLTKGIHVYVKKKHVLTPLK